MQIERTSELTGVTRTKELNVTLNQLQQWHEGKSIELVMSNLTKEERVFIERGIVPEESDEAFVLRLRSSMAYGPITKNY